MKATLNRAARTVLAAMDRIERPALSEEISREARLGATYVEEQLAVLADDGHIIMHRPTIGTWRPTFYEVTR